MTGHSAHLSTIKHIIGELNATLEFRGVPNYNPDYFDMCEDLASLLAGAVEEHERRVERQWTFRVGK
jgi:hypothetical protein